ncbi:hypothetical protein HYU93_00015 [Candidatus Daviesbacteria bacterium]|nr:hypothetical protein [Candidatus Daviesbacteria bacterium]
MKIKKIFLPYFPDSTKLEKQKWHKFIKIAVFITSATSLYAIFWLIALFYLIPPSWMDSPIYQQVYHISYFPAYLPINLTSILSHFPIYGTIFRSLLPVPVIGPLALILILISIFYIAPSLLYRGFLAIKQRFHLKKVKFLVGLVTLGLVIFGLYVWKYQQVVNEGSYLADEHCIKVNPLIIDRKNKYTDQFNLLMASASEEQYMSSLDQYRQSAAEYIKEEKIWLAKQRRYLDSKAFNLLITSYIKEASEYQYQMYEGQYLSSLYLSQAFDEKDKVKQLELSNKVLEETNRSNDGQDKYNAVWEREKGKKDWIFNFVKIPDSKCPAENNNFPDVPNPFLPPVIPNSPLS